MFKIAVLISLFAVAHVSTEKKNPINENNVLTSKKEVSRVAFLCPEKQTNKGLEKEYNTLQRRIKTKEPHNFY